MAEIREKKISVSMRRPVCGVTIMRDCEIGQGALLVKGAEEGVRNAIKQAEYAVQDNFMRHMLENHTSIQIEEKTIKRWKHNS